MPIDNGYVSEDGFFDRDSMARRVHREGVILLGGGRALLMQIAHPLVARGVAEHSSFATRRGDRLLRTLRPMLAMVFGTRGQALAAAASVNRVHEVVKGPGYRAADPDLLLWVHATLIDTAVFMYERFVRPLTPAEAVAYYEDMKRIGHLLQIPEGTMPETLAGLQDYVCHMNGSLQVTDQARAITRQIFKPMAGLGPAMLLTRQLTAGLLASPLRCQFDMSWGPMREAQLRALEELSRRGLLHLPLTLRGTPSLLLPPGASLSTAGVPA